jgi:hypothetical protein
MHGLVGGGRIASAATITSISYDITGGDFGSLYPGFSGPITGVSITYTATRRRHRHPLYLCG